MYTGYMQAYIQYTRGYFMKKSISHVQGKGSLAHNNREFITNNVDRNRIKDNVIFKQEPIAEAYHKLFDGAVADFNAKQKRADRKKKESYFEDLFNRPPCQTVLTAANKENSFYEDVVQVGLMSNTGVGTKDAEIAKECLTEYMEGFQERNPQFYVFNAVMHMDEATPHLHIDYIPVATGYKNGLAVRNGIAKALEQMGYGKTKDAISKWRESERGVLRNICERHGIEISEEQKDIDRKYLSVPEYKAMKTQETLISKEMEVKQQQYEDISEELKPLCEIKENLKQVEEWGKPSTFNKSKIVMQKEDYEKMKKGYEMAVLHKDKLEQAGSERISEVSLIRNAYHHNNKFLLETKKKASEILETAEKEKAAIAAAEKKRIQESMKSIVRQKENALSAAQEELKKAQLIRAWAEREVERSAEQEKQNIRREMAHKRNKQEKALQEAEKKLIEAKEICKTEDKRVEEAVKKAEETVYARTAEMRAEGEKYKESAQKEWEEVKRIKEQYEADLTRTLQKAQKLDKELRGIETLRTEKKAIQERVDVLKEKIEQLEEKNTELKREKEILQKENTGLKEKLSIMMNNFKTAIKAIGTIANHLKYLIKGGEMGDFTGSVISATEKYAEEVCEKAPLDEETRNELDGMLRKGTLNSRIQERTKILLEERKKQQEQQSYGMTR